MEELNEELNIEEFREYIETLKLYEDEQLDIVIKISSDDEKLRNLITNKIRKINQVQSTLTMMVIEK